MPSPMRSFRPDFRTIFDNLSGYEKQINALTMDNIYDTIVKIVVDKSLDETDTARLVKKSMLGAQQPEQCYKVIMQAIWPSHSKPCYIVFKKAETTGPFPDSDSKSETLAEGIERSLGVNATNGADNVKIFEVIDSQFTIAMDDDTLIIEKGGRAIPVRGQLCAKLPNAHPGGSYHAKQNSTTANPPGSPMNADAANNATQIPPSGDPSDSPGLSPNPLPQPSSSGSIDNNATQTPPSGDPSTPSPPGLNQSHSPQPSSSNSIDNNFTQTPPSGNPAAPAPQHIPALPGIGHHPLGLFPGRGAPRGQPPSRGQGRGGHRGGGHRGGGHRGGGTASTQTVDPQFTQRINDFPMPSGRKLQRTYGFTELTPPDAATIVLGPTPPPTLPPHVQLSTLPPGHPPQSYGPGAFPPNHNIPGTSSGNYNSGTPSEITEGATGASSTQPVVSDESPDSSETVKKRSRDDEDEEEETTRPLIRLRIEAPPPSSQADDTTITEAAPVASSSTLAPSDDGEGSSDNSSPKKRTRDAEEDEEETARPSARMRQELPAVQPRYPSPTPSDRRLGRIIAPFGTSIRFNPRPSSEVDIGSSEAGSNEGNSQDNSQASSSGSSTLPRRTSSSSDASSSSRSSQRIKGKKIKKESKKE